MNFFNSVLTEENGELYVEIAGSKLKLPASKTSIPGVKDYVGKEIVCGIRPEHVHDEEAYLSTMKDSTADAYVEVTEEMGAETYLYLKIGETPFIARVNPRTTAKPMDNIKVCFDMNKIHLFDKETEVSLINK